MKITTLRYACSLFTLLASLSFLGLSSVQAETVRCKAVGALPATITVPGIYCLYQNRTVNIASGAAITIATDNVVLDLNDHVLTNSSPSISGTAGIIANEKENITIKNGTVRGFDSGIALFNEPSNNINRSHLIEDIHVINRRFSTPRGPGIVVLGSDVIVRNNRISGMDVGIQVARSSNVLVINNDITSVRVGISFDSGSNGLYRDNIALAATPYVRGGAIDAGNNN